MHKLFHKDSITFVHISLSIVGLFVFLVDDGIFRSACSGTQASIRVLGDILVCLLGGFGSSALDGLLGVVRGIL
jgi:hypothetical protein